MVGQLSDAFFKITKQTNETVREYQHRLHTAHDTIKRNDRLATPTQFQICWALLQGIPATWRSMLSDLYAATEWTEEQIVSRLLAIEEDQLSQRTARPVPQDDFGLQAHSVPQHHNRVSRPQQNRSVSRQSHHS